MGNTVTISLEEYLEIKEKVERSEAQVYIQVKQKVEQEYIKEISRLRKENLNLYNSLYKFHEDL